VKLEDAVAVVADNWWRANRMLKLLAIEWDAGTNGGASTESIREFVRFGLEDSSVTGRAQRRRRRGGFLLRGQG